MGGTITGSGGLTGYASYKKDGCKRTQVLEAAISPNVEASGQVGAILELIVRKGDNFTIGAVGYGKGKVYINITLRGEQKGDEPWQKVYRNYGGWEAEAGFKAGVGPITISTSQRWTGSIAENPLLNYLMPDVPLPPD